MSQNLLAIERAFLENDVVKASLKLDEIKTINSQIENGQKVKFLKSLELAKVVRASYEWFMGEDGQRIASEEGINWNAEKFGLSVFGWQKSYFHKMLRTSKLDQQVVDDFKMVCDDHESQGEPMNRTIESLLKYAKEVENANNGGGDSNEDAQPVTPPSQNWATFSFVGEDGNKVNVKINSNGDVKSSSQDRVAIFSALTKFYNVFENASMNQQ
jgi:hypothetical protein